MPGKVKSRIPKYKNNSIILLFFILFACVALFGCSNVTSALNSTDSSQAAATSDKGNAIYLSVDSQDKSALPSRFRKSSNSIGNTVNSQTVSLEGLSGLNIAGSGQFTAKSLELVKESLGNVSVTVVDLRQESHGFINGDAVSWTDADDKVNKGLTTEQVLNDETEKLNAIAVGGSTTLTNSSSEESVTVESMETEKELVESYGMSYLRIPVTNNEKPTAEMVDLFISFIKSQKEGTWVYFHCREGVGRTTVFMFMYDCMKNAKNVSLNDIMNRQVLLGGKNLINSGEDDTTTYAGQRSAFLKSFYEYCKENTDNYSTTWSEWNTANCTISIGLSLPSVARVPLKSITTF